MSATDQGKEKLISPVKHYPLPRCLVDRQDYILSQCKGKRVLHVGFADFSSTGDIRSAVYSGGWLHGRMEGVARELIGLDSAAEAVRLLKNYVGLKDIYVGDAQHLDKFDKGLFDVIVAGELLEHLPCPGNFFDSAQHILEASGNIIITTTNAFCFRKLLQIARGIESVHEDHVAYFSHRTVKRMAEYYGYKVVEQCSYKVRNRYPLLPYLIEKAVSLISPNLCEGVIAKLEKSGKS